MIMIKMNYSKDNSYSAQANIMAISSSVLSPVSKCSFMCGANISHLSILSTGSGLMTTLLSSNKEHPDKSETIEMIMSIFFIRSIIAVINKFVN